MYVFHLCIKIYVFLCMYVCMYVCHRDLAEAQLAEALNEFAGENQWKVNPGDGAFYGPKIDIKVRIYIHTYIHTQVYLVNKPKLS